MKGRLFGLMKVLFFCVSFVFVLLSHSLFFFVVMQCVVVVQL